MWETPTFNIKHGDNVGTLRADLKHLSEHFLSVKPHRCFEVDNIPVTVSVNSETLILIDIIVS